MPEFGTLVEGHPMFAAVQAVLQGGELSLADLRETR
jgi:hypothetical protein